jgi:hypothetical protein
MQTPAIKNISLIVQSTMYFFLVIGVLCFMIAVGYDDSRLIEYPLFSLAAVITVVNVITFILLVCHVNQLSAKFSRWKQIFVKAHLCVGVLFSVASLLFFTGFISSSVWSKWGLELKNVFFGAGVVTLLMLPLLILCNGVFFFFIVHKIVENEAVWLRNIAWSFFVMSWIAFFLAFVVIGFGSGGF